MPVIEAGRNILNVMSPCLSASDRWRVVLPDFG